MYLVDWLRDHRPIPCVAPPNAGHSQDGVALATGMAIAYNATGVILEAAIPWAERVGFMRYDLITLLPHWGAPPVFTAPLPPSYRGQTLCRARAIGLAMRPYPEYLFTGRLRWT